jgi:hypothetical protein
MANRVARFNAIPPVPQGGLSPWEFATISALKENVELLTGARGGESANANRALIKGQVTVSGAPTQQMTRITAEGNGFTINNVVVPSITDYVKLLRDVQQLANDVANLRNTVNTLIAQLKV